MVPQGTDWDETVTKWKELKSDKDSVFDKEYHFESSDIEPMITFGTNPGMGLKIKDNIPVLSEINESSRQSFAKALEYMDFKPGDSMLGKKVDYVFVGSCTNGRIEDLRAFSDFIKGRKTTDHVTAWIVPGSKQVEKQAEREGIREILNEAGFEMRQPGCSACLAMNDDKVPENLFSVSTSNRNFEGRQGPGSRTMLASPLTAAAAAITGYVTDPRDSL